MEWLRQLSQSIDYIEDHLVGDVSIDEAAKIACCSPYYFQRMFSFVAGIPLAEYIRRRRMTLAAFELQTTETKVMEVGMKYGYLSPTSFNRAFQSVHGVAPTAARVEGTPLNAYPRIRFSLAITGGENIRYRIEKKDPFCMVGVRTALQEEVEQNFEIAPGFWKTTLESPSFTQICALNNQKPAGILGVAACLNPHEIYYYIAAATDKPAPVGMFELKIPAATWVIFKADGPFPISIQTLFRRFYTEWLPFSGYAYAELPDIEVYPLDSQKTGTGKSEVWIAIKKEVFFGSHID
jgi:AraC family transcriptional regulator